MLASVFLGQLPDKYKHVKEAPLLMAFPMTIVMILMLAVGVIPGIIMKPINAVMLGMGYKVEEASWTSVNSAFQNSTLNVTNIFYIFLAGAAITLIVYLVSAKSVKVTQENNYTCGELPSDWGTTPERFNFSYGFYQPFQEMFNPLMALISFDRWMRAFGKIIERISNGLSSMYTKSEGAVLMLYIGVAILIIGGWMI